ncbi:MAG: SDR family oxidoreductase [Archangium sp.]|nr:SDR family oxidoreductase [Archangium sp.]MDP3151657.1 SDR family oxidoreductase [Archangium sp.]MDP3571295.1 SDR family oxidoreductase [Archangium sp.]
MTTSVAVVTGASSGIGRALAKQLDAEGYSLVLCDVNEPGLRETQALLERGSQRVTLDVSNRAAVQAMAADVIATHGRIDLVINNAGVTVDATIAEVSLEDFEWLFGINFWGVVYGTKAFLPKMLEQRSGTIVNISSVFGMIGFPRQGTYNASKFAVRGFTEALWCELEGTGVTAVSVHPGGIKTNIARDARSHTSAAVKQKLAADFHRVARTTPEEAAEVILRGVYDKKRRVMIGADAQLIQLMARLLPEGYPSILAAVDKRAR